MINLGIVARDEKFLPAAEKFFGMALQVEPDDPKTHFLLALTFKEDGKTTEARAEVEKALQLRPGDKQIQALREELSAPPAPSSPKQPPAS